MTPLYHIAAFVLLPALLALLGMGAADAMRAVRHCGADYRQALSNTSKESKWQH